MPGLQEGRVEESLAFLQKTSSKNGQSVFDHFVDVVQQVRAYSVDFPPFLFPPALRTFKLLLP